MSSSGGHDDGGDVTAPADGDDASADASTSTTTSSSSSDGATTTGELVVCDCAPDEICVLHPTDSCSLDHSYIPSTECVPMPEACDGMEPACDTECGWEICGGPGCHGFVDGEVCSTPTQGFLCGSQSFQCNLFTQDCARGEKCTSWSSDGAMCLGVDPDTLAGICRSACVGNPYDASCEDPEMQCSVMGEFFAWCMPA